MTTDAFDFDAWLESVRGETVHMTDVVNASEVAEA